VLVRDVAYGQIPRATVHAKHLRAAEWIESLGPSRRPRRDGRATTTRNALELTRASRGSCGTVLLHARATRYVMRVVRAASLNACRAGGAVFHEALELTAA
jgi:hypothetical protein